MVAPLPWIGQQARGLWGGQGGRSAPSGAPRSPTMPTPNAGLARMQSWRDSAVPPPSCYLWGPHERPREGQGFSAPAPPHPLSRARRPRFPGVGAALSYSALVPVLGSLSTPEPRPRPCLPLGRCFQIQGPQRQQLCAAGSPRQLEIHSARAPAELCSHAGLESAG